MPDTTHKNKLLFDFYQNIKDGTEVLSIEDLEIAIQTMELAKEKLKINDQKRIKQAQLSADKEPPKGKVLYLPRYQKTLYANVFKGNEEIVKVVLNEGLREIGEYAFAGCTNLREIIFPNNRIILRKGCFKDCTALKEVYIPDVSNIGPSAFENCAVLENVILPATLSNVYSRAFRNCRMLKNVEFCGGDANATWFYSDVFENCSNLETIRFPIRTYAYTSCFENCSNLKEIYGKNLQVLGDNFIGCDATVIRN